MWDSFILFFAFASLIYWMGIVGVAIYVYTVCIYNPQMADVLFAAAKTPQEERNKVTLAFMALILGVYWPKIVIDYIIENMGPPDGHA